ncbi:MAG: Dihydropteroate synthase [Candidatus Taylorbacteria bacterium]|nr:Dihydropteroate synthase [Candidatus Taylorbacteria bacterium]
MVIPKIVGILNISPESFSGDGLSDRPAILARAKTMTEEGADIIDIGAQSTRPGAKELSAEEEIARLKGLIAEIRRASPRVSISIDTTKSEVAALAIEEGADMVNDISGARFDGKILAAIKEKKIKYVLMHSQGSFADMHKEYVYDAGIVQEVRQYFIRRIQACLDAGLSSEQVILDPGFGFSKNAEQNAELLRGLGGLRDLGHEIYIGLSRKRFIGTITGEAAADRRDNGTTAAHMLAMERGVEYIRTHNVVFLKQAIDVMKAVSISK